MQLDYFFFYTEASIVCILILGILLLHDHLHSTRQEKQIWFDRTLIAHIFYFLSDIGWAAVISGHLPKARLLVILFNFLNYILLGLIAYGWFMYMASSVRLKFRNIRKIRTLCLLPLVISLLVIITAFAASPYFWVSENGELNTLYYPLFLAAPLVYIAASSVFSLCRAKDAESREERRLFLLIGLYPISVVVFGLIQTTFLNAPLFCFGCTVMMLFFYLQNMQTLVSIDSLTRLNNRGQISRYMQQASYKDNVRSYAMMIDIDGFKKINDTYGHAEGDRALILVSDVLKQTVEKIKSAVFLGRYGGDEFTVFLQCGEGDTPPDQVIAFARSLLDERQQGKNLPYQLKISVGYAMLRDKQDTMEACLVRADENLYENKRAANVAR